MQNNGSTDNPYAPAARNQKSYQLGSQTGGYQAYTPPRSGSSEVDMPGWTTMPEQPKRHSGVYVGSNGTRRGSAPMPFHRNDVVAKHLLVETALLDSQNFELLAIEEVDALKKEKVKLDEKLEAGRKRLARETKMRDAAQSLHRLYTDDDKNASPTSPKKQRTSFLDGKGRSMSGSHPKAASQAGGELATSQKKIDEVLQILSGLESRRQYVESRLLRHTSAVLQLAHQEQSQAGADNRSSAMLSADGSDRNLVDNTLNGFLNGSGYEESIYSRQSKSGLNGLANGFGSLSQKQRGFDKGSTERLMALQMRLDSMNSQIRSLIQVARGEQASPDKDDLGHRPTSKSGEDPLAYLDTQIDLVDKNVARLEQECGKVRHEQENTEGHLAEINKQLYLILQTSSQDETATEIQAPPSNNGQGTQPHLEYLEASMENLETLLDSHETHLSKSSEHERTLHDLWSTVTALTPDSEPFSLPGLQTRVQHVSDKATHMETQADILRRQIQQQRDLNSKSDGEKDAQLADLHAARAGLEKDLDDLRERQVAAESETHGTRAELDAVVAELERLQGSVRGHEEQKASVLAQLESHATRSRELEAEAASHATRADEAHDEVRMQAAEHEGVLAGLTRDLAAARDQHGEAQARGEEKAREAEGLEAEVVRLTTELTMAKAELDGAYGSRAERAREVASAELEEVRKERDGHAEKVREMEGRLAEVELARGESAGGVQEEELKRELAEMVEEYQDLTRESVEVEKEREQLETLVDGLRERCETLETQLSDERVRWLGVSSPTASKDGESAGGARETTSAMVLRNEFKRMMRETRAENARMLRAEQDERKKLETMIRNMRRENMSGSKGGLAPPRSPR